MKELIKIMKALSDQNRARIIAVLACGELCVCELTTLLGVAQPTVSKHLRVLEDAGLVSFRKEGNWMIYRINGGKSDQAGELLDLVGQWMNKTADIKSLKEKLPDLQSPRKC